MTVYVGVWCDIKAMDINCESLWSRWFAGSSLASCATSTSTRYQGMR